MSKESALQMIPPLTPPQGAPVTIPVGTTTPTAGGTETQEVESTRFASLAKREAKHVAEREAWVREKEAARRELESEHAKLRDTLTPFQKFEELRKTDAVEAMKQLGFTETDIFNFMAASEKKELTPEEKAAAAADARIKEWEEKKAQEAQLEAQNRDEAYRAKFKTDLHAHLETNKEKYEYCAFHGALAEDMAYRTVQQILNDSKGQDFITMDEAYGMVEELYEEEDKAMANLKKRQPKLESPEAVKTTPETPAKPQVSPGQPSKAVTNAASLNLASHANRNETPEQKRTRLMEKLRRGGV